MSEKVRWGVIGTASIARRRFAPAVRKSSKSVIAAIGSRDTASAEAFAREFGIPRAYGSYQQVLDDPDVEAVYIPLPHAMHREWTIKAADAGKHILCEKPLSLDSQEAADVIEHCRTKGVMLMEGFMYRLNPRTLKLKEIIDSGLIGEVMTIMAQFTFNIEPGPSSRLVPGKGGGCLMDVGCYCINISRYIFGGQPVAALAVQHSHPNIDCDMTTSAVLDFGSGRTALLNCSFESAFTNSLRVVGANGVITMERFAAPADEEKLDFVVETSDGQTHRFTTEAVNQFLVEIDHFADCVRGRTELLLDPQLDALANMQVIDAVRESAKRQCLALVAS